jgi:1,2-phenylacetyl-CoA epoxidase catalytic subunit
VLYRHLREKHLVNGKDFVTGLLEEMGRLFARLGETETLEAESEGKVDVVSLLKLALKSELEASELAGLWMPTTPEVDAKLALAQQCGDEMKHYALISQRLVELGEDLSDFDPLADGHTPLYQYLRGLRTTVERIAGGPFASEAIAEIRNSQFVRFCQSVGDEETARLYAETIQPEEVHHHHLGRDILIKYATTPELQELAAAAVRNTLAIADELRDLAGKTTGVYTIPVS